MNWIEKAFGISPDGGNGLTEMLLFVGAMLVSATVYQAARRIIAARRMK